MLAPSQCTVTLSSCSPPPDQLTKYCLSNRGRRNTNLDHSSLWNLNSYFHFLLELGPGRESWASSGLLKAGKWLLSEAAPLEGAHLQGEWPHLALIHSTDFSCMLEAMMDAPGDEGNQDRLCLQGAVASSLRISFSLFKMTLFFILEKKLVWMFSKN